MKLKRVFGISTLSLLTISCANTIVQDTAEPPLLTNAQQIQQHVDKAHELAGDSFMKITAELQCTTDKQKAMRYFKDKSVPPATQVFDNLYYVGIMPIGAWAINTSDGIVLIDALNNDKEAEQVIEKGLITLGLDPSDIKYIVVTHGHGDHYGGATYFVRKYGTRVIMSQQDWQLAANPKFVRAHWPDPPAKDMVSTDGQQLTLGDTTVTLFNTPGHTPGTISVMFPVYQKQNNHTAVLWGGTGFPRDKTGIEEYVKSTEKLTDYIKTENIDVVLSNHPFVDDSLTRMKQQISDPSINPFIIGKNESIKYSQILGECAKAALLR